jgi:hypothetical protein
VEANVLVFRTGKRASSWNGGIWNYQADRNTRALRNWYPAAHEVVAVEVPLDILLFCGSSSSLPCCDSLSMETHLFRYFMHTASDEARTTSAAHDRPLPAGPSTSIDNNVPYLYPGA